LLSKFLLLINKNFNHMKYNKGFIGIGLIVAIIAVLAVGGGAVYVATKKSPAPAPENIEVSNYEPVNETGVVNSNNTAPAINPSTQLPVPAQGSPSQNPPINNGAGSAGLHSGPSQALTQAQAEALVTQTWGNCSQGDCSGVVVTFAEDRGEQYLITAIFTERDDSVSQTKRELLVKSDNNGGWIPSSVQPSPNESRTCHRGNADGTTGWTTGKCI
jgi:hypothetical protein